MFMILFSSFIQKKIPDHLNDVFIVPTMITTAFVVINLIIMVFVSIFNKDNLSRTLIIEGVAYSVYIVLILLVSIGNNHIIKVNEKE